MGRYYKGAFLSESLGWGESNAETISQANNLPGFEDRLPK